MEEGIRLTLTQMAALTMEKAIGCFADGCNSVQSHQYFIHVKVLLSFGRKAAVVFSLFFINIRPYFYIC